MTVALSAAEELRHPPPENLNGSCLMDGSLFRRSARFMSLEDTVLEFRKSKAKRTLGSFDLLNCKCVKGKRAGQIVILNSSGKRVVSFSVTNMSEYDKWFSKLQYAASWGVEQHYALQETIGKGGFGNVYRAESTKGEELAVKVINVTNMSPRDRHLVCREVELLPRIAHPNIVKTHDIFIHSSKATVSIAMELLRGGDMLDYINLNGPLSENDARGVLRQVLGALRYLHREGIVHRDLKPENILLRDDVKPLRVAITDFGLADTVRENGLVVAEKEMKVSGGTIGYMAPEIVLHQSHTTAVDLWACGVVLYIMLSCKKPFWGSNEHIMTKSLNADFNFGIEFRNVSAKAKKLIRALMTVRPNRRLTAETALLHPWFNPHSHHIESVNRSAQARWRKVTLAAMFADTLTRGVFSAKFKSTNQEIVSPLDLTVRNTSEAE